MKRAVLIACVLLAARAAGADTRSLWLRNLHTHEDLRVRPFASLGMPDTIEWARLNRFFRSWRTGDRRPINPRLLRVLAQIQRHFGGRPLDVVSGYRVPEDPAHLTTYHAVGHAIDFRIAGVDEREIYDYAVALSHDGQGLGVGLYPLGHHVHVDVRVHSTTWVDLSRYGEPARYVTRPVDYTRAHPNAGRALHPRELSPHGGQDETSHQESR